MANNPKRQQNPNLDCLAAAYSFARRGWSPIPILGGEKAPKLTGWQNLKIPLDAYPRYFRPGMNIGVRLGEDSGWLVDVDLDCADALFLAPEFLPSTEAIFGRQSKPKSHLLFRVSDPIDTLRLKGVDGAVIVELRGNGCQTVFPPSVHSGEHVEWVSNDLPSLVDGLQLRRSVVLLAIACVLVPTWPEKGSRHEFALSLSGGLLSSGLDLESAKRIIKGVCHATGDEELGDRLSAAYTTAHKITDDRPATGWTTVRGQVGREVVDKVRSFIALLLPDNSEPTKAPLNGARKSEFGSDDGKTAAERLLDLAKEVELYHTPDKQGFATIPVEIHVENWPLQSREFRSWLLRLYYEAHGKPPAREAMNDAIAMLEARAIFEGPECQVFTRLAHIGGNVFLDLCDQSWRVVRISPAGWEVLDSSPVHFRRARGMLALPTPVGGGSLDELRDFIPAQDERGWTLLVSWLIAAVYPQGPFPILVLQGEAGTAKSTTSLILRNLIDPSKAPLRSMPRDDRDLMISAQNSWVMSLDNISKLPVWLSDALCRLATGGGLATRELYTDDSEKIFDSKRPIILNGIDELAERDDLADRALVVNLARIPENKRRSQRELLAELEKARPRVLAALLRVLSNALADLDSVRLSVLPRMADFALLITAAEPGLGWPQGLFMRVYMENRADAAAGWVESDSVAVAVLGFMKAREHWKGTSTELLAELKALVNPDVSQNRTWPQTPQSLSNRVRRAAPALRTSGIEMDFDRESRSRRRLILLSNRPQASVPSDPSVPNPPIDSSKTAEIETPIPAAADGDTGDTDIKDDQSLNEPNIGLIRETFQIPENIWHCIACGRDFDSRSACRLHTLNRSCVEVRESPATSTGSENQKGRGDE